MCGARHSGMVRRIRPGISRFSGARLRTIVRASRAPGMTASPSLLIPEIRLDGPVHLDGQRIAVAVLGIPGGHAHPALADAIFLDIGLLDALEADTDVARQYLCVVRLAARIDTEPVGKLVSVCFALVVHSRASISFLNA